YAWPPAYLPHHPTLQNYRMVLFGSKLGRYIVNSVIVSSLSTISVLFFTSLAAYSIARIHYRGRTLLLVFFLSMSMFPQLAIVPSLFIWFRKLGLINNYAGIVLAYTGLFVPIALWILATYFRSIPLEIEESATLDGCGRLRTLWRIILPLSTPGVIAASLIVFIQTWNEFFLALVLLSQNLLRTATVGIALYPGEYSFPWELITTATLLAILPVFLLTSFFQKQIIGGLTAGAVK
ncbi:MAG TPA: carbohydrate ABC transporter permease, partial [Spirochaetia bacterium]|nr:carbohydrate ABC transporter permease [Spirochaetia bacterium]